MADEEEPDLEEHTWTYLGRCITSDKKLGSRWEDHHGALVVFGGTDAHGRPIGSTFTVEARADSGRARVQSAKWIGKNEALTEEQIDRWKLEDQAAYRTFEARRAERRLAKDNKDIGAMTLNEIHRTMQGKPAMQKTAMLTVVLDYLRY